jgi:hypothetical protein
MRRSRAGDDLSNKAGPATFLEEFLSFHSLCFKMARNDCTDHVSFRWSSLVNAPVLPFAPFANMGCPYSFMIQQPGSELNISPVSS